MRIRVNFGSEFLLIHQNYANLFGIVSKKKKKKEN